MFRDRTDAGEKLAAALACYEHEKPLVLAIPRGGVEVGYQVAKHLHADFSILISRKLPFPHNPESGFGAIAEDGSRYVFKEASRWVSRETINDAMDEQKEEIKRRIAALRRGVPLPEITGRTVILVDDGIAMGSTMRASIMMCRNCEAGKIVVASPVSGRDTADEIAGMVDHVVILEHPVFFQAVAQVYMSWYDVPDSEVMEIMERWERDNRPQGDL